MRIIVFLIILTISWRTTFPNMINFKYDSLYYIKNNEYFYNSNGYTVLGYMLKPRFEFKIDEQAYINIGLNLSNKFGSSEIVKFEIINYLDISFDNNINLVIGTLKNNRKHQVDEQLISKDSIYLEKLENGIQIITRREKLDCDIWLSWDKYIGMGALEQEELFFGSSIYLKLWKYKSISTNGILQTGIFHKGGQIDNSGLPIKTVINYVVGNEVTYKNFKYGYKYLGYNGIKVAEIGENSEDFKNGYGNKVYLNIERSNMTYSFGFWNSYKYISEKGEAIFNNNRDDIGKNIVIISGDYNRIIKKNLKMHLGIKNYYDIGKEKLDYNFLIEFEYNN